VALKVRPPSWSSDGDVSFPCGGACCGQGQRAPDGTSMPPHPFCFSADDSPMGSNPARVPNPRGCDRNFLRIHRGKPSGPTTRRATQSNHPSRRCGLYPIKRRGKKRTFESRKAPRLSCGGQNFCPMKSLRSPFVRFTLTNAASSIQSPSTSAGMLGAEAFARGAQLSRTPHGRSTWHCPHPPTTRPPRGSSHNRGSSTA
jgi:hypothetical protein